MIQGVKIQFIDKLWPHAWAVLHRAFIYSDGEFTEEKVYNGVKSQDLQLWLDVQDGKIIAAGITRFDLWPTKLVCWILGFAAENNSMLEDYLAVIETWAKKYGATECAFQGRLGLEPSMKKLGFKSRHIVMSKQLGE